MTEAQDKKQEFDKAAAVAASKGNRTKPSFIVAYTNHSDKDAIRIENLTVRLPGGRGTEIVKDVNMTLKLGERLIVTGESGSGKSTWVKSILGGWNIGEGTVSIPADLKTMTVTQKIYFPNMTLENILNMAPESEHKFTPRELRDALEQVGLNQLIQHLPGQQVEIMMGELLEKIKPLLEPYKNREMNQRNLIEFRNRVHGEIQSLVQEQFDVVQYVPDEQREYFKKHFNALLRNSLESHPLSEQLQERLCNDLLDKIDIELATPLREAMISMAPSIAMRARKYKLSHHYSASRAANFAAAFYGKMIGHLDRYLSNKDTEDPHRVVRLNKVQAENVAWALATAVKDRLQAPPPSGSLFKGALKAVYNAATLPLRLSSRMLVGPVHRHPKEIMAHLAAFMERQIVKGDQFAKSLSGGQQKMLACAQVLLHKPEFLLLDEITSGLDKVNGPKLYQQIMKVLPEKATVISIVHHEDSYLPFHTLHAHLQDKRIHLKEIGSPKRAPKTPRTQGGGPSPN